MLRSDMYALATQTLLKQVQHLKWDIRIGVVAAFWRIKKT